MINISKAITKLKQNIKKILKLPSPAEESVVDMGYFSENVKTAMDNINRCDKITWNNIKNKKIETDIIVGTIKKVGNGEEQEDDLIKELKARGEELTIKEMFLCFKDMELGVKSEDHADMYWLIFYTLEELGELSFPPTNLLRLYNKFIMGTIKGGIQWKYTDQEKENTL